MIRALYTSSTGMQAQQLNIDVIANNLANVNTTGFKKSRPDFQDLMYQTLIQAGTTSGVGNEIPTGIQLGLGTRPVAVQKIFTQGDYQETSNDLDLAIEGAGFFQVQQPDGTIAYTRAGSFKLDSTGAIVTSDGYPLQPTITIPADTTNITITDDGTVSVIQAGAVDSTQVGTLELASFSNPSGLKAMGRNLFTETGASGPVILGSPGVDGLGTVTQGFLEMSNVSVVDEMVNMIVGQRAYEINSKAIQTADEMLQTANNVKR
ncbi:MAG: flagellar basal-body rod protein FlgG [Deltaproteobacteria bacterium]|nr:flagellar basal-body rod protein FlgG [Candidatus Anaeroferrophillus wilburensis]MBN2889603.1 flagellar basal-body rod protein FlgG [Deltaproteobacteria bacterium]